MIVLTSGYRYYQYEIKKNFIIKLNTICDPNISNCFTAESEDINFGQDPYEKVSIVAKYAPVCLEEHICDHFLCPPDLVTSKCVITYCSEDTISDGESCINNINNK